jgi:exonuclease III
MQDNKFDILGISESKLTTKASSCLFQGNSEYQSWWNCLDSNPTSAGVGLIFHHSIARYVQLICGYKGHIIFANLFLRGNVKLRIIQVYIQAPLTDKAARLEVDNYIITTITSALQQSFQVIIMGDFNADPNKLAHII